MSKNKNIAKIEESIGDEQGLSDSPIKTSSDEISLQEAVKGNPFRLFFVRNFIKIKNHIATIPLLMSIVTMIIVTCTIPFHVNAMVKLHNEQLNAFYFFIVILCSILIVMCYMNTASKKSSKNKKIIFFVLFTFGIAASVFLDFYYLHDISVETNLFNHLNQVVDDENGYIASSKHWTTIHLVFLFITYGLAVLAPFVQPFTKKIHINSGK